MKKDFDADIDFTNVRDKRDPNGLQYSGKGRLYGQLNEDGSISTAWIECPVGTTMGRWGEIAGRQYKQIRPLPDYLMQIEEDRQGHYHLDGSKIPLKT
jgi:hypothetical protein